MALRAPLLSLAIISTSVSSYAGELSTYIYNGTEATTDTFPSIATLYYDAIDYSGLYGMYCGATILDEQHVLTAAHCLYDGDGNLNEEYLIYTSIAIQLENENDYTSGDVEIVRASEFYTHPDYIDSSSNTSASWPNDIAIIKLASSISVSASDYVVRASSSSSYRVEDEEFIAVGHGYTENGDEQELLQTTLNYELADACDLGNISDSQLCMSGELNADTGVRNTTCSGDSGGPLYWHNGTEYVQAGITSYGWSGCFSSSSDDTSVFTEVADYETWIENVLAGNETPDYTVTDEDRSDYSSDDSVEYPDFNIRDIIEEDDDEEYSTSSSSGGGIGLGSLLSTLLLLGWRRKSTRA